MKTLLLITTLLVIASCNQAADSLSSSRASSASSNAPSKWSQSVFPLNVKIATTFTGDESDAISDMADAWSTSVSNNVTFFDTTASTANKNGSSLDSYADSTMGVYKLTTWPSDLPSSALAVTQIYGKRKNTGSSSEYILITHADIMVNYQNFSFTTDGSWGYDLQTIILHELGHFVGLYHQHTSIDSSVMYPSITRYVENRVPKADDIDEISSKYSIARSGASRAIASISAGDSIELSGPDEDVIVIFELMADFSEKMTIKAVK